MSDNFQNGQGNGFEPQNPDNSNFAPNNGAPSQDTNYNNGYQNFSGNDFDSVSGVENVTKAHKGKKAAIIAGIAAVVVVGGSATAYACSDYVKNKVKLTTMKPENYYAWVCEENADDFAKSISEMYKKGLDNYDKGSSGSVYVNYDITSDAKDALLTEIFGEEDYTDADDDESKAVIDAVNNIESIKVGADFSQDKTLASYSAYAQLNGDNIISAEAVQDLDAFDFFLRSPELTEKWLGIDMDDAVDDSAMTDSDADYLEIYREVLADPSKYLSPEDFETEINRYVGVWGETIKDVELEKSEEVDICDISVKYTIAEIEIDDKFTDKLAVNMLRELKNDDIAKKLVTDKLGLMEKSDYKDSIQNMIDSLKDKLSDNDYYDDSDAVTLKTYIDAAGKIRGFSAEDDATEVFAVFGKDSDDIRGEIYSKTGDNKGFSVELTAKEEGKGKYSGQIDMELPHEEYDDDTWETTTTMQSYTLTFKDFEIVNEDKGYFNADVSIIVPDMDPIDIDFKSSGKEQEVSYNISFEGKDFGTVTLGFSSEDGAKVEKPDESNAYIINADEIDSFDINDYITRDNVESWAKNVLTKIGFSDDLADDAAKSFTDGLYSELDGEDDYYDDWYYDDDDLDYDDDDDDDWYYDDSDYKSSSDYDGVTPEDGEAYLYISDAEFDSYYTGYYDDYLAGNAKVAKITGNGEYTVGVTTDSELFREYWQASTPKGFHNIEIKASGIEGAEDSVLTVKSIKINGKEQEIKQQPVSIYNYEDSIDVELFYEGYEEDAVLDVSSIDEWTDFEVTFELSGLPE